MRDSVPGISVPQSITSRLRGAKNTKEEGLKITLEIIEHIRTLPGVHGIHIMAVGWEEIIPDIVSKAGLLPRPVSGKVPE
jgi:methylenetetrahydrofolate reductase (NADPH)